MRNLTQWLFQRPLHDVDSDGVISFKLQLVQCGDAAKQRHAAARNDAFLDCRACGMHSVFNASLLFLQLGFRCRAHFNHRNSAHQLRQPLLQFLAVVIGSGVFDLRAHLFHAAFDVRRLARAFDERGVVLINRNFLDAAQVLDLHVLKLDAEVFGQRLATGEDGDVFEHRFAAIAEARSLHGSAIAACRGACSPRGWQVLRLRCLPR